MGILKWEQVQKEAHTAGLSPGLGTQSSVPARAWLGPARCAEAANNCPGKALQRGFRQGHADIPGKGTQALAAALLQLVSQQSNFH